MKSISSVLGVSRSNLCERAAGVNLKRPKSYYKAGDSEILLAIKAICCDRASYGYRRVTALLNRQRKAVGLEPVNHKRIYRVMRYNELLLQRHTGRPTRTH